MSVTNDQKTELLFKQFNNVVNAGPSNSFSTTTVNKFPFRNYVANEEIFSNNIPPDLSNVTYTIGPTTLYGVEALDISNEIANSPNGTVFPIPNTDLTFYYRLPLDQATAVTARTWFKDDGTGQNNSVLRDSIPFNYDTSLNSYQPKLFPLSSGTQIPIFSSNQGNLFWLLDYKSGFVEFYGTTSDINTWVSTNTQPRISFIKYTGPKGASGGGGGGGGGDASFNNVDISGDLTVANLTVTDSAELPKDTLIQPIFYRLAGSHQSNNAFFDKEYAQTQSYNAILADPSVNLITDTDWITIARVAEPGVGQEDGRGDALFKISHPESGRHETITFIATFKFGSGMSINVLQHDWYSGPNFKALRIGYDGLYNGAVLQLQFTSNLAFGRDNPLAIYIKDDHDYPGWEQFTDISGTPKSIDGILVPYAIPNNTPSSAGSTPVPLTSFFPSVNGLDITWNPTGGKAHQITTNPSKFEQEVDIRETLNVNGDITVPTADVLVPGGTGLFNGLNVTNDAIVGQTLTVNDDGYVSSFETTGFNTVPSPARPYLARLLLPQGVNNIKNTAASALFELVVSDQDPADETSERNHIIVGTITMSTTAGTSSDADTGLMINILHSSWCDRIGTPPVPLVSRVFIQGQNLAGPPISNVIFTLWLDSPFANLGYVSFKLKDNGLNTYGAHTTNFGRYWIVNSGLAGSIPSGNNLAEAVISKDENTTTVLAADIVNIPNTLRVNNIETTELEIGDSNNKIVSQAHQITLDNSIIANDWFTIAQIGPNNTSGNNTSSRGVAIIEFYNRISSRHQVIRMFVSQIFNVGGSLEVYNVGYNGGGGSPLLSYQQVRIVSDNTYDGALLQVQAGNAIATGPSNPHFVNLMLSTNDPAWKIVDDNSTLLQANNPVIYTGPNQGSFYGQPSQGWTEISLLSQFGFTNTQGPRAYTGKVSTLPTTLQDARLQVRGENITAWKENGFGGNIGSIDGVIAVQSLGGDDITMELDLTGNAKIGNLASSNGKNITLESDNQITLAGNGDINILTTGSIATGRNIILDNTTGSEFPYTGDLIGRARSDIAFLCENRTGANKILFETYGSSANNGIEFSNYSKSNPSTPGTGSVYTMRWSVQGDGLNVDEHNISDIGSLIGGPNNRTVDMVIRSDNRGLQTSATAVHITSPLRFPTNNTSTVNSGINAQSIGTMAYDVSLNGIVCKPDVSGVGTSTTPFIIGTATEITLWDKLTQFSLPFTPNPTYVKGGISQKNFYWPIQAGPIPATGGAFEFYRAPFDGYLVAVDFGGTAFHQTAGVPAFTIERANGFNIPGSSLILEVGVGGFNSPTLQGNAIIIGTILTGPSFGGSGQISTNDIRWQYYINPSQNRITFKRGERLDFRIRYISNSGFDRFRASWNDYTTNGTLVNININVVYHIPH